MGKSPVPKEKRTKNAKFLGWKTQLWKRKTHETPEKGHVNFPHSESRTINARGPRRNTRKKKHKKRQRKFQ